MGFKAYLIAAVVLAVFTNGYCKPTPDSADIIPLVDGLAYGGIPYGSVSGQLSQYFGPYQPITSRRRNDIYNNNLQHL